MLRNANIATYVWVGLLLLVIVAMVVVKLNTDFISEFTVALSNPRVRFMTKEELQRLFALDRDRYVAGLSAVDLVARKAESASGYLDMIQKAADDIGLSDQSLLLQATKRADALLSSSTRVPGFNGAKAAEIPWVFAKTKGRVYEGGMPHTRMSVVFITDETLTQDENGLVSTLVHEKVHLYQRLYPDDVFKYIQAFGYQIFKERLSEQLIRANPDVDPYIYLHPETKSPMGAFYVSGTPKGIKDVDFTPVDRPEYEHPFEMMAYGIADVLTKKG